MWASRPREWDDAEPGNCWSDYSTASPAPEIPHGDDRILILDTTIDNYHTFYFVQPGVTIRSLSGSRDAVVIQGDSVFHADGSRTGGTVRDDSVCGTATRRFLRVRVQSTP